MMTDIADLARSATPALLGWLMSYGIHSTILLGAAWVLSSRARSQAVREALWKTALFGGFVTASAQAVFQVNPLAGRVVMQAPAGFSAASDGVGNQAKPTISVTAEPGTQIEAATLTSGEMKVERRAAGEAESGSNAAGSLAVARLGTREFLVLGWVLGAALLVGVYLLRRMVLTRRLARRRPVMTHPLADMLRTLSEEAGITRPIRLTASTALASPVALGTNEIAIPEAALTDLSADQQRGMLAHELAHLERRDPTWLAAMCLAERIGFFQPLNRLARRRIQESAEYLCDEWAVQRLGSGVFLAKCLAKVAEWMDASPRAVPVAGMAEEKSHLVARVRRLLDSAPFPVSPRKRTVAIFIALGMVGATLAVPGISLARRQAEPVQDSASAPPSPVPSPSPSPSASPSGSPSAPEAQSGRPAVIGQDSIKAIIRALMVAAGDTEVQVRRAALNSLRRFEDPSTIPAFREALRDADAEVRSTAIEALAEFKDRSSVGAIAALLKDENVDIRRSAASALRELPAAGVRNELVLALQDSDAEVRANAIGALANLKDAAAADALVAALKDPKPEVRARAIEALHEMELPSTPAGLLEALRDQNAEVRHQAVHAIGHYQDVRAVPTLRAMLEDPNAEVREAVVEALGEIRNDAAIDALVSALKSKDPKVRKAAADALGQREP